MPSQKVFTLEDMLCTNNLLLLIKNNKNKADAETLLHELSKCSLRLQECPCIEMDLILRLVVTC